MSVKTAETTDEQEELEDDVSSEEVSSNEDDKVDEDKLQILRKKLEIKLAAKEAEEKEAAKEDSAEESVEEPEEKKEEMPPRIIEKQRKYWGDEEGETKGNDNTLELSPKKEYESYEKTF